MNKISVFVLAFVGVCCYDVHALSDEHKTKIKTKILQYGAECIQSHPLSIEDIVQLRSKKIPPGKNAGCFANCVFKKIGLMDDSGNVSSKDAIEKGKKAKLDEETLKKVEELVSICAKVNDEKLDGKSPECERAKLAFGCFHEHNGKFGFDIDF